MENDIKFGTIAWQKAMKACNDAIKNFVPLKIRNDTSVLKYLAEKYSKDKKRGKE